MADRRVIILGCGGFVGSHLTERLLADELVYTGVERSPVCALVDTVPSLPAVVCQLQEYLDDPEVNFDQLSRVIECDPGLTANVLQLANSAYFGWQGGIGSVRDAISRLGTKRIFQMVLCMSVAPLVRKPIGGYDLEALEARRPHDGALGHLRFAVGLLEGVRFGPGGEGLLRFPQGMGDEIGALVRGGPLQQVKLLEARHPVEVGIPVPPDLLEGHQFMRFQWFGRCLFRGFGIDGFRICEFRIT